MSLEITMKMLWAILFLSILSSASAAEVEVVKETEGWKLLVDGKLFFVKGVCYLPTTIGESAHDNSMRDWMVIDDDKDGRNDLAFQSWIDKNRNDIKDVGEEGVGDFQLLKDMGCNAIRVYHHPSSKYKIQSLNPGNRLFNHSPNKALLRYLHKKYGIWVMMGDLLGASAVGSGALWDKGTDFSNPVHRRKMMQSVQDMVLEFKDEPYILIWALGNENNYELLSRTNVSRNPEIFAKFVNKVAHWIHEVDPNHPVCLVNGAIHFLDIYAKYAQEIDIFGVNSYPLESNFGKLWIEVANKYDKPVLLTEYGYDNIKFNEGKYENIQANFHKNCWLDIFNHSSGKNKPGNAIGGFAYEWLDNWWLAYAPLVHNIGLRGENLEWLGISSQGNGNKSPLLRQLRKVYFTYKKLWASPEPYHIKQKENSK